eukprot:1488414-Pleurochrysis_carterae.AAC.3
MPFVGRADLNGTASGDPTNLRFDRPCRASPTGLLRQRGARRRDYALGADCLEQRSDNQKRGGECGDRKSRRAVAELTYI